MYNGIQPGGSDNIYFTTHCCQRLFNVGEVRSYEIITPPVIIFQIVPYLLLLRPISSQICDKLMHGKGEIGKEEGK